MSNRQWVGGGNNNAVNPNDWSPTGTPVPGDTLNITSGVLNLSGGDLAGDTLHVRNLSGQLGAVADPVINVSHNARLSVALDAPSGSASDPVINIDGHATVDADLIGSRANAVALTENIAANSVLQGVISVNRGSVTINGVGPRASFDNDGVSTFSNDQAIIKADIVGHGQFALDEGGLELTKAVGAGQRFLFYAGSLTVDDPGAFKGTLAVTHSSDINNSGRALFEGVHATSYDFAHNRITLYDGQKSVLSVRVDAPYADAHQVAGGIMIFVGQGAGSSPAPVLPMHSLAT